MSFILDGLNSYVACNLLNIKIVDIFEIFSKIHWMSFRECWSFLFFFHIPKLININQWTPARDDILVSITEIFFWICTSEIFLAFLRFRWLVSSNIGLSNRRWRHQKINMRYNCKLQWALESFDLSVLDNITPSHVKTYFSPKKLSISS